MIFAGRSAWRPCAGEFRLRAQPVRRLMMIPIGIDKAMPTMK